MQRLPRRWTLDTGAVLFFSDVVRELDAAREAGCQTRLVVREGNAPVENAHEHMRQLNHL